MIGGYLTAWRDRFDHPIFRGERFCRGWAWDWLCAAACIKQTSVDINGRRITLERGQLSYSTWYLARRWGWSQAAVRRFLSRLQSVSLIVSEPVSGQTVITICNFDKYHADNGLGVSAPVSDPVSDGVSNKDSGIKDSGIKDSGIKERETEGEVDLFTTNSADQPDVKAADFSAQRGKNNAVSESFREFYKHYPKKVKPKAAEKAFAKAVAAGADPLDIIAGCLRYAAEVEGKAQRFIAHPSTWLNDGRWMDEPTPGGTPEQTPDKRISAAEFAARRQEEIESGGWR